MGVERRAGGRTGLWKAVEAVNQMQKPDHVVDGDTGHGSLKPKRASCSRPPLARTKKEVETQKQRGRATLGAQATDSPHSTAGMRGPCRLRGPCVRACRRAGGEPDFRHVQAGRRQCGCGERGTWRTRAWRGTWGPLSAPGCPVADSRSARPTMAHLAGPHISAAGTATLLQSQSSCDNQKFRTKGTARIPSQVEPRHAAAERLYLKI